MRLDHALDRLACAMATTRNRRGLLALGAATAALAAGPSRSVMAATTPALNPQTFAANKGINDFALLMNRVLRNYEDWQAAIGKTVASANRKNVAALGDSVAADLGKIAGQVGVMKPHSSITFDQVAVKMKEIGLEAELNKRNLTVNGVIANMKKRYGTTVGGMLKAYETESSKSLITEEIALIRQQVKEVLASGKVSVKSASRRPGAAAHRLCSTMTRCVLMILGVLVIVVGIVVVALCVTSGPAAPACLAAALGLSASMLSYLIDTCHIDQPCRRN